MVRCDTVVSNSRSLILLFFVYDGKKTGCLGAEINSDVLLRISGLGFNVT